MNLEPIACTSRFDDYRTVVLPRLVSRLRTHQLPVSNLDAVRTKRCLVVSQSDHRVDAHGTMGRHVAGKQRGCQQK
jgi:hypothetical protein